MICEAVFCPKPNLTKNKAEGIYNPEANQKIKI